MKNIVQKIIVITIISILLLYTNTLIVSNAANEISNYQAEIPEIFIPDEDIVLYDSIPDLLDKIGYYLEHDEERKQIAKKGYEKVKMYHSYDVRLAQMFRMAGLL